MIALERASARRPPLALANVHLELDAGVHAIVGGRHDGGALLLALLAGAARPRAGRVRVLDGAPSDPRVRPCIAWIPLEPALPPALRVAELVRLAESIRGEPHRPVAERLGYLGLETLAARPLGSLSRAEARAVALAEALTSARVRVLLVEEPLVDVDGRALGRLPDALRARGREGWAVVLATASTRDAGELADDCVLVRTGKVVGPAPSPESFAGLSSGGVHLTVVTRSPGDARRLVAALASDDELDAIEAIEVDGLALRARGREPATLARAAGRAAVAAGVDVVELRFGPTTVDAAPAAIPSVPPPPRSPLTTPAPEASAPGPEVAP